MPPSSLSRPRSLLLSHAQDPEAIAADIARRNPTFPAEGDDDGGGGPASTDDGGGGGGSGGGPSGLGVTAVAGLAGGGLLLCAVVAAAAARGGGGACRVCGPRGGAKAGQAGGEKYLKAKLYDAAFDQPTG